MVTQTQSPRGGSPECSSDSTPPTSLPADDSAAADSRLGPLARAVRWISGHGRGTLLGITAMAGLATLFLRLADYATRAHPHALDERLVLALRNPGDRTDPLGPRWFEEMLRDVTALGSLGVLLLVTLATLGFLLLSGRKATAVALVIATGSGFAASLLLKAGFDRTRPDLVPHGMHVLTKSFPSGHAMMAATCYLTMAAFLTRVLSSRVERTYVLVVAILVTLFVGASRVYLGVHWPSDVLAGWTLGGAWAVGAWTVTRSLQRRGTLEPSSAP